MAADGSEDVNDFLQRIKELGDTRDREDEERNRKLEEEILEGRKQRQARRAERARSISPTKSSPANTPTASRTSIGHSSNLSQALSPTIDHTRADSTVDGAMERLMGSSGSPTKENSTHIERGNAEQDSSPISPLKSPASAMPSRNSPLSWQQRRPNSQSSDRPRSRPLSMVATENAARSPRATPPPELPTTSIEEPALSRDQIAQSLASKDPAWFRQTADRGINSPAYRRNQVEDEDRLDHGSNSSRVQMPGMSRENSQLAKAMSESQDRSPSRTSTAFGSSSRTSTHNTPGSFGSPIPLTSAQRLDPPILESTPETRGLAMSPSQGRISPDRLDRPHSPTKGMGGFVQSAMMKRSDSVSKRWSVQSPPGLSRGNSVASNRSSLDPSLSLSSATNSTPRDSLSSSLSRDNSPLPPSRPTSSHSNATITQEAQRPGTANSTRSSMTASTNDDGFVKPGLPASRTQVSLELKTSQENSSDRPSSTDTNLPISPSKTMDTRRWSPTKSSWLETALNKPESPKPKPVVPIQQPSWKSEISKAKQISSADATKPPITKHEVNIGGLMRSPPPGGLTKPLSIRGLPVIPLGITPTKRPDSTGSQDSRKSPTRHDDEDSSSTPKAIRKLSPAIKPKPETPPKKDFRSVLKPRQPPPDDGGKEEPEFKNVFGQLRRTKTQNYVAPDELKDNITRGKAALNLTGGPKKTERKDELKEAILKKKEDFKNAQLEGKGVARSASSETNVSEIPEALAKRQALGKNDLNAVAPPPIESTFGQRAVKENPKPTLPVKEESAPGRLQSNTVGGKLAGRFNPALAGLLARGPPSVASDTSRSSSPTSSQRTISMSTSTTNPETLDGGPQLTHMTKGRARGPRRKAPSTTTTVKSTVTQESVFKFEADADVNRISESVQKHTVAPQPVEVSNENPPSQPSSPRKLDMKRRSQFLQEAGKSEEPQSETPKPLSPTKKANTQEVPLKNQEIDPETKTKPPTPTKSPSLSFKTSSISQSTRAESSDPIVAYSAPLSPKKSVPLASTSIQTTQEKDQSAEQANTSNPGPKSVKNAAALWDRPSEPLVPAQRAKSPIKLPTYEDEKITMRDAGLRPSVSLKPNRSNGLGIQTFSEAPATKVSARPLPTPPAQGLSSPPLSASLSDSRIPQASDASVLIAEFFHGHVKSPPAFTIDTAALLTSRPEQGPNLKTMQSSLFQLSSDGKKQLIPSHQERFLFEGEMYLCIHVFSNAAGKKMTEVYFWTGDDVPASTVQEVEIFAQREAKSSGGKLVKIRQGKETVGLFQALGGTLIIRRGSSNKYDSLAPHVLCSRKYFGMIAFDEMDYSLQSLCSGFPYLISTPSGKSYLWKGRGSGVDELGCAKLIGSNTGLTGEIEEIEDGKEPASFLQIFGPSAKMPKSADHWRLKPNYNKYSGRLFCADSASASKAQIIEISPFCQSDLLPSNIYILDAFFEIYIIVGRQSKSQYSAFHNALLFAQEYGILAAGMEDRPFVPVSTVVIEGIPKDLKSVFRKWRDELAPTITQMPSENLRRGRSLRVVPLTAALEATR